MVEVSTSILTVEKGKEAEKREKTERAKRKEGKSKEGKTTEATKGTGQFS